MTTLTKKIAELAMALPATERASLVDELLATLDQPDPAIDALWVKECEDRIVAIARGEMDLVEFDATLTELRNKNQ